MADENTSCCGKTVTETNTTVTKYGMEACPSDLPTGLTYVGMRYIINFADPIQWSSETPYEHLTAVQNEGFTYISKKAVPVGVPVTNEEFWLLWADPNSQMEELRQLVAQYIEDVQAFDTRITENAEAIQEEATAREEADNGLQQQINNLNISAMTYDYFKNKNVLFIGDSYTYGTGASDHGQGDTKRYSSILANALEATEFNYAIGATGFCDTGNVNGTFKQQVINAANGMTQEEKDNTHLVIIAGGVNDYREGATFSASQMESGANAAALNAKNNFPNALILVVPMLYMGHSANARLWNFENAIINGVGGISLVKNTTFIRGAWTWNYGLASHYTSDNLHPNDLGHKVIAAQIYSHILGGDAYENRLLGMTFESGFSGSIENGTYWQFFNGLVCNQSMRVTCNSAVQANTSTKIASISPAWAPIMNAFGIIGFGNAQKGIVQITTGGNIYITSNVAIPAGSTFFMEPMTWLPGGTTLG